MIPEYRVETAGLFQNQEHFEIEIEVDKNSHPHIYPLVADYVKKIKSVIKIVMSGLQESNFPISYHEKNTIANEYMKVLYPKGVPERRIRTRDFIRAVNATVFNVPDRKNHIWSSFVIGEKDGASIYMNGLGMGHGVGLCQYGAQELAGKGESWKDILKWYYPGATINT